MSSLTETAGCFFNTGPNARIIQKAEIPVTACFASPTSSLIVTIPTEGLLLLSGFHAARLSTQLKIVSVSPASVSSWSVFE